jgi:hypothetical protein
VEWRGLGGFTDCGGSQEQRRREGAKKTLLGAFWRAFGAIGKQVKREGPEAREFEAGIDVVFDDVEGEVVEAAEAPNRNGEQDGGFEMRVFEQEQDGGEEADEQEEEAFEFNPGGVGEVGHA